MGYLATDIGRIPSEGFDWFIYLIMDDWKNEISKEIEDNFNILAKEVGPKALVVKGIDPKYFTAGILETYGMMEKNKNIWNTVPALLISDTTPKILQEQKDVIPKIIYISLLKQCTPGTLTNILRQISRSLSDNTGVEALQSLDRSRILEKWGWITKYLDIKPNFFGFGIDLDEIIDSLMRIK